MTLLLGPLRCASCHRPVSVVRRGVPISGHRPRCGASNHPPCVTVESAELREVVVLDAAGARHRCRS
jgi:hypothetical protein